MSRCSTIESAREYAEVPLLHPGVDQHLRELPHPLGVVEAVIVAEHDEVLFEGADLLEHLLGGARDEVARRVDADRAEGAVRRAAEAGTDGGHGVLEDVEVALAVARGQGAIRQGIVVEVRGQHAGLGALHGPARARDGEPGDVAIVAATGRPHRADLPERVHALAEHDEVDLGHREVLGVHRGVVAPDHGQAARVARAHLPQGGDRGTHVHDLAGDPDEVGREVPQRLLEVLRRDLHVDEPDLVLADHPRADGLEAEWLDLGHVPQPDGPRIARRVDEQDPHVVSVASPRA
ncbi:MAG: hypothetical protein M5U28_30830 [Sandaracinaceae bacterium]|nr:hypothetical protein [Sandaracinaceae bacterium]